jgi:oxalate decarboxylase/phosphoglucose isomerase-like protein (cupin superfamily)
MNGVERCRLIELPKIEDVRGSLTFVEQEHVEFSIQRVYWIYDVPGGERRGGHGYRELEEVIVALSGAFDVVVDDGRTSARWTLNRAYLGLYVPNRLWRTLENFSTNGVALILASRLYDESDYIRDYDDFKSLAHS